MDRIKLVRILVMAVAASVFAVSAETPQLAMADPTTTPPTVEVQAAAHHDISVPLHDQPVSPTAHKLTEKPLFKLPVGKSPITRPDGALQTTAGPAVATGGGLNFAGVGNGDYGFAPNAAPPDTNGAVGATQYVQWVNESFAVFDKVTGAKLYGPVAGNTLWKGFGGGCEANNDGDPIVQYDKAANRWIFTQFSVTTTPYLQCVAVSSGSDAITSVYNRYSFDYGTQFPDYPKLGVWPDAYYISFNIFNNGTTFAGSKVCAYDRTAMLAGAAATQQCFQLSTAYGGLLPSDLDGIMAPPPNSPNFFLSYGTDSLNLWKFHVDFQNSTSTSFTGPINTPVAAFTPACNGGTCIPQLGTRQLLDSLADRLMYRLAYRNFGDHESLVVNQSVAAGSSVGLRWYEVRNPNGTPTISQQSTYAPDSSYRWMGSIAMDRQGNIALGYSVSSGSIYPGIRYTGRLATDAPNTMAAENSIIEGGGSQLRSLSRWGDYSAMTVDPVDDCTFWYTSEYLKSSGTFNWSTRIASFKFPNCTSSPPVLTTITVSPASASVPTGGTQQFTATALDQFNQSLTPQPTFTWTVTSGGTISPTGLFTAGPTTGGPFTVTASSGSSVTGTAAVTVTAAPVLATITVSPASASVPTGGTQLFTATAFDQLNQPLTPQPTFIWTVSGGGTISSTGLFTAGPTAGGPFTVMATSASVSGTASVTVTATPADFSLALSPPSQSVRQGNQAIYTVTVTPANGFSGSVNLSVSGLPAGATATFAPNPTTSSSTLTIQTVSGVRGTFSLTVTGVGGSLTHSTTATLIITKR